ncbi:MAG: polyprenyl synthetase family protein [Spirochaetales bacterium]|nr:polyprenyl synthetase family protein [Spirochaetales bacterium]
MKEFFAGARKDILDWIHLYLSGTSDELARVNAWGPDVCRRLEGYMAGGKMIRGGLVRLFEGLYGGRWSQNSTLAGAAMEFLQAALLVHDDIMDQDTHRRGMVSIHEQYRLTGEERGFSRAAHTGESLGICAGDAAFFFGLTALEFLKTDLSVKARLQSMCYREMLTVSVAQMQDVAAGVSPGIAEEDDIDALYRFKTGRYTFSLPMMTGALLGGADDTALDLLSSLGEELGIVFQLKDDYLGLFGDSETTGKPVGSDIAEGKQTLYFVRLMKALPASEKERVRRLFGTGKADKAAVETVRALIRETGVGESIEGLLAHKINSVREALTHISSKNVQMYRIYEEFIDYNLSRTL